MPKRHVYDDGAVLDVDDDVGVEDLPEGEDDITDEGFAQLLAAAEAREAANAPDDSEVEDEPDGCGDFG